MRVLPLRRTWRPVLYGSRFFLYFATATLDVGAAAAQQHLFRYLVITQSGRLSSRSPSSQQGLHVFSTATRVSARVKPHTNRRTQPVHPPTNPWTHPRTDPATHPVVQLYCITAVQHSKGRQNASTSEYQSFQLLVIQGLASTQSF